MTSFLRQNDVKIKTYISLMKNAYGVIMTSSFLQIVENLHLAFSEKGLSPYLIASVWINRSKVRSALFYPG